MAVAKYAQSPCCWQAALIVVASSRSCSAHSCCSTKKAGTGQRAARPQVSRRPALFDDGIGILEARGGVPVLGVIPYLHNLAIPEEDAVAIEPQNRRRASPDGAIDIAVIALPRIANFDDFDALAAEHGVSVRYVSDADELGKPDAVILPGEK